MKNSLFAVLLTVAAVLQGHAFTVNGINYTVSDEFATVTGAVDNNITKLVIPATVSSGGKTYQVVRVNGDAFWKCVSLKELIIEDSNYTLLANPYSDSKKPIPTYHFGDPFKYSPIEKIYIGRNTLSFMVTNTITIHDIMVISSTAENVDLTIGGKSTFVPIGMKDLTYSHKPNIRTLTIGGSVREIKSESFAGCVGLKKVTFAPGDTELSLEDDSFSGCELDSLILYRPISGGKSAGKMTVNTVVIAPEMSEIRGRSFSQENDIKHLVIEDAIAPIQYVTEPFRGCEFEDVYLGREQALSYTTGTLFDESKFNKITFGKTFHKIRATYCNNHSELESVDFLGDVTVIEEGAFRLCSSLKNISFPESLVEIESTAFEYCSSLGQLDFPESLQKIGMSAFSQCTNLSKIRIPVSLKSLGGSAFSSCGDIDSLIIEDSPEALELTHREPFRNCKFNNVYIGRNSGSGTLTASKFSGIVFGQYIIEIPATFCYGNTDLKMVEFSENMKAISSNAFYGCTGLENIISHAKVPPVCYSYNDFAEEAYVNATLTVPVGAKNNYRNAEVWKLFKNIVSDSSGYSVIVDYDSQHGSVSINGIPESNMVIDEESSLTVTFNPADGYSIGSVVVNGIDVTESLIDGTSLYYESLDSNLDIKVDFKAITYSIIMPSDITGGTIVISDSDGPIENVSEIPYHSNILITVLPDYGYDISLMSINGKDITALLDENKSYSVILDCDFVIDAAFTAKKYTVTHVNLTDYGILTLNGITGDCVVEHGDRLVISVSPRDEGCYLVSLTVDGVDVSDALSPNGLYIVEKVESDIVVEAVFGFLTYRIEYEYDATRGKILSNYPDDMGDGFTIAHGETAILTIIPYDGFEISTVKIDGDDVTKNVDIDGNLEIQAVKSSHSIEVIFDVKRVRLTVLGLDGGCLSTCHDYGSEVTLIIEPEDGWQFHSLTIGDMMITELESDGSWTIPGLVDDTAVSVVFKFAGQSSVESIAETGSITVTAQMRTITVDGIEDGEIIEVFDIGGTTVYHGSEHIIKLNRSGVHIVSVSGQHFKVLLK